MPVVNLAIKIGINIGVMVNTIFSGQFQYPWLLLSVQRDLNDADIVNPFLQMRLDN